MDIVYNPQVQYQELRWTIELELRDFIARSVEVSEQQLKEYNDHYGSSLSMLELSAFWMQDAIDEFINRDPVAMELGYVYVEDAEKFAVQHVLEAMLGVFDDCRSRQRESHPTLDSVQACLTHPLWDEVAKAALDLMQENDRKAIAASS